MQNNRFYGTMFDMKEIIPPSFPDNIFYTNNEDINDNRVIQRCIDKCSENGGGCVVVTKGEWESGAIHLRSNIHLKFEKGAVVTFSDNVSDYLPVVFTRWEGMECYNYSPLIYANNCENIAITGEGILNGNGGSWWDWKHKQQKAAEKLCYAESLGISVKYRVFGTEEDALRPSFIQPINCKNILIEGVSLIDGPQWTIHPVYCENVIIRNVKIQTKGHNTDGLNPDSCKNILVEDSFFNTGDDCVAINSGMNEDGWRVNKICENIVIRNCVMTGGHGGVVIGSAVSGGVRNVYAHDCKISKTNQGIRMKSMRGRGGFVTDVWFDNIEINDVNEQAVQINMFYQFSTVMPKSNKPTDVNNINISNIFGKGSDTAIEICGLPEHKLRNINLKNINLAGNNKINCSDIEEISLENIKLYSMKEIEK